MNTPFAYLSGRFLPFHEAALPLHDAGFTSGATVVDNARTFRLELFRWPDHLARFRRDCESCFVPLEATDEALTEAAQVLISHHAKLLPSGCEFQLVTFATPGPLGFYLGNEANGPPTLGMHTYQLPFERYRPFFMEGATLAIVGRVGSGADAIVPPTVKHRSRMAWHVADRKAREATGVAHALAVSLENAALTETSVANLLAVIDGVVVSPPQDRVLDGISLRVARELCSTLGFEFVEKSIVLSELAGVSELMLTGTGFGLAGVKELHVAGSSPLRFPWPGPVYRKLLAAWSELVGVDIAKQFVEGA